MLPHGSKKIIAERTKCSYVMIRKVLSGNAKGKRQYHIINEAIKLLIEIKQAEIKKIETEITELESCKP